MYKMRTGEDVFFGVGSYSLGNSNMGKCFKFTVEGVAAKLLLQVVNQGGDVHQGAVDLQQVAGGIGLCNALTNTDQGFTDGPPQGKARYPMFAGDNDPWGPKIYGGFTDISGCDNIPRYPDGTQPVNSFPNGEYDLQTLCRKAFELGMRKNGGANPAITSGERVECPRELYEITGLRLQDDGGDGTTMGSGQVTRMFDGCKPSAGWLGNTGLPADPKYPAVIPCGPDGITRVRV